MAGLQLPCHVHTAVRHRVHTAVQLAGAVDEALRWVGGELVGGRRR